MRRGTAWLALVGCLCAPVIFATSASADGVGGPGVVAPPRLDVERDAAARADAARVRSRMHLAQEYLRELRYEDALELYGEIHESYPNDAKAVRGLKTCLLELKRYDQLLLLLEQELRDFPEHPALLEEIGTVAARKGDRDAAVVWWNRILEVQQHSRAAYSFVADLFTRNRMLDEALATYAEGEVRFPGKFIRQKASLHEQRFEFGEATLGYMAYLETAPTGLSYVEGRLLRIGEAEEGLKPVIERVEGWMVDRASAGTTREVSPNTPLPYTAADVTFRKLLGDLYLEAGDHEGARLQYFALVDRAPAQYASLLVFGKRCQTDGEYRVATEVFERIVGQFPDGRAVPSALTEIARCQTELHDWDDALATYARISENYPETDYDYAAQFESGRLLRRGLQDPAAAAEVFMGLLRVPRGPWSEADPQFEVAECALWQGDLVRARGIYSAIRQRGFSEGTQERALFEEARTLYYDGEVTLADSLFKDVVTRFPKGDHVNDALDFSILINTNLDDPEVVAEYASARLSLRRQDAATAIVTLNRLTTAHPGASITDEAFLLLGEAYRDEGEPGPALDILSRAVARAGVPDLAAKARLLRARILAEDLNDTPRALAEYEELLVSFPETLAADRARDLSARLSRMIP